MEKGHPQLEQGKDQGRCQKAADRDGDALQHTEPECFRFTGTWGNHLQTILTVTGNLRS